MLYLMRITAQTLNGRKKWGRANNQPLVQAVFTELSRAVRDS